MNIKITLINTFLAIFLLASPNAYAEDKNDSNEHQQVTIAEAYIERHTGPGSGFPIFFVKQRGNKIEILSRKTDWFKVHTESNKTGWVNRSQLEKTLTEAGVKKTFKDSAVKRTKFSGLKRNINFLKQ